MPTTASILLYCVAWILLVRSTRERQTRAPRALPWLLAGALLAHGAGLYTQIVSDSGYQFSLFRIIALFFWTTNLLILLSNLRKPLHNLFLVSLPLSVIALLANLYLGGATAGQPMRFDLGMAVHILLSILAYSAMIVATVQALVLAYQNYKIRHKHPGGLVRLLPPLETMETLLFEMLWFGQVLLTLVIFTGLTNTQSVSGQHLHHKIAFTIIAWITYGVLLWGRHARGWRGNYAIRWTLSGFGFLVLAYLGSKLVLELILGVR